MIDVWKIGQEVKANDFYQNTKNGNIYEVEGDGEDEKVVSRKCMFIGGEMMAANILTKVCDEMSKTYDQIIQDQNAYLVDIDTSLDEIMTLETDLEAKIKELEAEIEELQTKKENGTITEEEEAELEAKTKDLDNLKSQAGEEISGKQDDLKCKTDKAGDLDKKVRAEIATDYGNTAIEKGEPLSQTKDKRKSFWRKAFGGWNKQYMRDAGQKLIDAGEGLLERVDNSSKIDDEIAKKIKKPV